METNLETYEGISLNKFGLLLDDKISTLLDDKISILSLSSWAFWLLLITGGKSYIKSGTSKLLSDLVSDSASAMSVNSIHSIFKYW